MLIDNTGFEIMLVSLPEYECLVAEIYFNKQYIALVSQERGPGKFDLHTPGLDFDETMVLRQVDVTCFIDAVQKACKWLAGEHP